MANNPFGKIPGGMGGLMAQAQKMMDQASKVEEELGQARVEASAGGGMVRVEMNGKAEVIAVKIAKEAVDPDDVEMLEDLVTTAVREAIQKANDLRSERLKGIMPAGMNVPGMQGLF